MYRYVFPGMFLKASPVIFYTSCSYNYFVFFFPGQQWKCFCLLAVKVESETNAGFTVMTLEVNEDTGKDTANGEALCFFFNLVTSTSLYGSVCMPPTASTVLFYIIISPSYTFGYIIHLKTIVAFVFLLLSFHQPALPQTYRAAIV